MHQTMKKTLAFLLTLCLILSVVPLSANAALVDGDQYITQQLSLGEDLVLHLRASLPESAASLAKDAVGTITYAGKTATYTLDDLTPDENGMYDMPVEMAVAEMTDDIHAVVKAKILGISQEIINEHYSIRDYLVTIIEGDYSQTTKDLCLELLNMGAWAQLYFNHNISDLANANYSTSAAHAVPEESPAVVAQGKVDGIKFHGTSVRFLSQTAVRFYFEADGAVDGYTFTIDGTTYEPVAKDGMYYIETPGINPQDMSNEIAVSVTNGTQTLSVDYAPIWYFIRTYNKSEDDYTKGLMEAAYSYYKTTESYKTQICIDVEASTLSGNYESIALGFYPLDFEGDINNQVDKIEVPTGTTYTVKLDQGEYLVDGEFKGIGITVLSGPAWDSKLEDGSEDKHNIQISEMRLEGPEDRTIDLTFATIASGTADTGYTNAANGGIAAVTDGIITFSNGIFTDGYKITFNEVDTYLKLDMEISTLSGNYETIGIGFYPYDFEGDINNQVDKIEVPTGTTYTVKLDLSKYLVDGELPGIGITVLGGPTWDAKLEDGTTPDRHNITVSNIRLEGELNQSIDLSMASLKSGQDGTGYTNANAGGTAVVADGIVSISNGFFTDGYKLLFVDETIPDETEPEPTNPEGTDLKLDMEISTLSGNYEAINIGFYPYNFEGDINNHTDIIEVPTGSTYTVNLDASKYLIDGELPGIGITVLGGPAWDAKLEDGYTPDRHNITVSNIRLEGEVNQSIDLSKASLKSGQDGTGYTNANAGGTAVVADGIISITGGFFTDGYKVTFFNESVPEPTEPTEPPATEPPVEEFDTTLSLDVKLDTLGGDWAKDIEIRFYPYSFEGNPHETYADSIIFKAGVMQTVKLDAEKYLIDGELTGIGIGIFGGPAWDAKLPDGYTPDRHTVTISNVKLEGTQSKAYDLSQSTMASGTAGTGYTDGNGSGVGSFVNGVYQITNGFCYDVHKISLVEDTNTYITMDMQIDTLGGDWAKDIEIRFYPYSFEGNPHQVYTDSMIFKAGQMQSVKLNAEQYLVDGELTGIGIGIFGGPAWDAKLPDGYTPDRHTVTISNVKLEGGQYVAYDLSQSTMASGTAGTGYTDGNGSGVGSFVNGVYQITNGFCYDVHKISLVEDTNTYLCMDMLLTTLGNSTDPVNIRLFNYNYEGSVGDGYTDLIAVTAGTTTKIKVKVDNYLIDGELPGFGFAVFGGPEWNTQLEDGTYDRHSVVISNVRLEGVQEQSFDLNAATVANGTNGTGFTWANSGGTASIVDGELVITGGFMYDAYELTF